MVSHYNVLCRLIALVRHEDRVFELIGGDGLAEAWCEVAIVEVLADWLEAVFLDVGVFVEVDVRAKLVVVFLAVAEKTTFACCDSRG